MPHKCYILYTLLLTRRQKTYFCSFHLIHYKQSGITSTREGCRQEQRSAGNHKGTLRRPSKGHSKGLKGDYRVDRSIELSDS